MRDLLRTQGNDEEAVRWIDELLDAASEVLAALATGRPPVGTTLPLRRIEAASRSVRSADSSVGTSPRSTMPSAAFVCANDLSTAVRRFFEPGPGCDFATNGSHASSA